LDHLDGSEVPKGLYVYDNGWKGVPLIEKNLKGVLLSLLLYLAEKASKKERNEILTAYKQLRNVPRSKDKIMLLLRELEKEKGVKIGLEI